MEEPTVADMSFTTNMLLWLLRPKSATFVSAFEKPEHAILVREDILGVVTARDIFAKMAEGLNATKVKVDKIMEQTYWQYR